MDVGPSPKASQLLHISQHTPPLSPCALCPGRPLHHRPHPAQVRRWTLLPSSARHSPPHNIGTWHHSPCVPTDRVKEEQPQGHPASLLPEGKPCLRRPSSCQGQAGSQQRMWPGQRATDTGRRAAGRAKALQGSIPVPTAMRKPRLRDARSLHSVSQQLPKTEACPPLIPAWLPAPCPSRLLWGGPSGQGGTVSGTEAVGHNGLWRGQLCQPAGA